MNFSFGDSVSHIMFMKMLEMEDTFLVKNIDVWASNGIKLRNHKVPCQCIKWCPKIGASSDDVVFAMGLHGLYDWVG